MSVSVPESESLRLSVSKSLKCRSSVSLELQGFKQGAFYQPLKFSQVLTIQQIGFIVLELRKWIQMLMVCATNAAQMIYSTCSIVHYISWWFIFSSQSVPAWWFRKHYLELVYSVLDKVFGCKNISHNDSIC